VDPQRGVADRGTQDAAVLSARALPLDVQMEAHIAADRTSIAYRRLLKKMGLGALYVS
jgi:hypothetical protein